MTTERKTQGKTKKKPDLMPPITLLMTPHHFFYRSVYIIDMGNHFRLVTNLGSGKINTVELFRTLRGARISFARVHKRRTEIENLSCTWTDFFRPEFGEFAENIKEAMNYTDTISHMDEEEAA